MNKSEINKVYQEVINASVLELQAYCKTKHEVQAEREKNIKESGKLDWRYSLTFIAIFLGSMLLSKLYL